MSCADCAGEMVECVDCRADSAYAAAREEGRREGYAACTTDVVAHIGKRYRRRWPGATPTGEIVRAELQLVEDSIALGEHVGAAGKGKK